MELGSVMDQVNGGVSLAITDCLSTQFSGSCAPALPGETCHLTMVTGKIPIAGFAVGATKGFGLVSKSAWLKSQIMSGS